MNSLKDKLKSTFGLIGFILYTLLSIILLIAPLNILGFPIWIDFILLVLIVNVPFIGDITQFAVMVLALIKVIKMPFNIPVIICYISLLFYALYLIGTILGIIADRRNKKYIESIMNDASAVSDIYEDTQDKHIDESDEQIASLGIENSKGHNKKGKYIAVLIVTVLALSGIGIYFFNINSDYNKGYKEAKNRIDLSIPDNQNTAKALAAINTAIVESENLYFAMNNAYFNFNPYDNNYSDIFNNTANIIESLTETSDMIDEVYRDTEIEELYTISSYLSEQIWYSDSVMNDIYEAYYSDSFPSFENMSYMMNSMLSLTECSKQYLLSLSEYLYLHNSELRQNEKYMSGYSKYIEEALVSGGDSSTIPDLYFICAYLLTESNLSPYINMLQYSYDSLSYSELENLFITDMKNYLNSTDENLKSIDENSYYLQREDLRNLNNDLKSIKYYCNEILDSLQYIDIKGLDSYSFYNNKYYEARTELVDYCSDYSLDVLDKLGY